jgi:tetratricopeptide (TPR) repeat protein
VWIVPILLAAASVPDIVTPQELIVQGHWKRARVIVEQRYRTAPREPEVNFLLSQIRNAFGDRRTPLDFAEKAVALAPGVGRYHRQLAEVQGVMAQRASAFQQPFLAHKFRKEIEAALALDPKDAQAMRDLVEFYLLAPGILGGDNKKAEEIATGLVRIDAPEGFLARARIAGYLKNDKLAGELTSQAAAALPASYRAAIALARYWMDPRHLDLSAAETAAQRALQLDRGRIDAHSILAIIQADRRDWNALKSVLAEAQKAVPDDATPYYRAAERMIVDHSQLPLAESYLRNYLSQEPEGNEPAEADARWLLGLALEGQGRRTDAIAELKVAVRLDSSSPAAKELKRLQ